MWFLFVIGCAPVDSRIEIRGSDSEVNLVQRLAEAFMVEHPGVAVTVTGGGSGVGIASLLDGTVDLANSSRDLHPTERLLALRKGVDPVGTRFAADALTVIVHEDNPSPGLTLEELGALYSEDRPRWAHGTRAVAYGRQSSSGTFAFFREAAVQGDYSAHVREMNGNAQIVEAVAADPGGIGYVAVGYLREGAPGVRALPIAAEPGVDPVDPLDREAVLAGQYALTRPLFQFSDGNPRGPSARFLAYELSGDASAVIEEMGFYPALEQWREADLARLFADR